MKRAECTIFGKNGRRLVKKEGKIAGNLITHAMRSPTGEGGRQDNRKMGRSRCLILRRRKGWCKTWGCKGAKRFIVFHPKGGTQGGDKKGHTGDWGGTCAACPSKVKISESFLHGRGEPSLDKKEIDWRENCCIDSSEIDAMISSRGGRPGHAPCSIERRSFLEGEVPITARTKVSTDPGKKHERERDMKDYKRKGETGHMAAIKTSRMRKSSVGGKKETTAKRGQNLAPKTERKLGEGKSTPPQSKGKEGPGIVRI